MRLRGPVRIAVALAVVLPAGGCDAQEKPARVPGTPDPAHAREVDRNPYAITCGDLARQHEHPDGEHLVIRAEFALAGEPELRKRAEAMTLNRAGRSVYWALTAFCKGREPSYRPAKQAVDAVRRGKYLVQPRPESWNHP